MPVCESIQHLGQVAIENVVELVEGQVDAVIGQPALRKIVGADALRAVAAAHEASSLRCLARMRLLCLTVAKAGGQHFHGLVLVAMLGPFVLTFNHQSGWQVGDADGRFGLVDVLPAGA